MPRNVVFPIFEIKEIFFCQETFIENLLQMNYSSLISSAQKEECKNTKTMFFFISFLALYKLFCKVAFSIKKILRSIKS